MNWSNIREPQRNARSRPDLNVPLIWLFWWFKCFYSIFICCFCILIEHEAQTLLALVDRRYISTLPFSYALVPCNIFYGNQGCDSQRILAESGGGCRFERRLSVDMGNEHGNDNNSRL
ncbi:hypothetical protein F4801DRAFT_298361 [Xylaria longipes]|nr:hypothetical protein F4801DRAFT_298361 [Xylaria longipes]